MTLPYSLQELDFENPAACERWDQFLLDSVRGQHVQLTTWLRSYLSYGGKPQLIVAESNEKIRGGIGIIALGNRFCRLAHCPAGPIVDVGHEDLVGPLLDAACQWARRQNCVTLQVQQPATNDLLPEPFLLPQRYPASSGDWREGPAMAGLAGIEQMLWIPFPAAHDVETWTDLMFQGFSSSTRRNLRIAERAGVVVEEARSPSELQEGYAIIEQNGIAQGYPTRTWEEFGPTLCRQSEVGHASLFVAKHDGKVLGAVYGAWAGRRFTDSMAGTLRTKPDLKIGYYVRFKAMQAAWQRGMLGYDLTADGPPGVKEAKYGFGPTKLVCVSPQYLNLAPLRMAALRVFGESLKRHRRTLVNLTRKLKK